MLIFSLNTKKCMNQLLLGYVFDSFLFIEGEITTFNTFRIDGRLKSEFYRQSQTDSALADPQDGSANGREEGFGDDSSAVSGRKYALWREQRPFCFSVIKGKRTPLGFSIVLSLSAANIARLIAQEGLSYSPDSVQGLYLNFKYDGLNLTCTTGTSMNLFTLDKTLEQAWDKMAQRIFAKYEIPFEILG